MPDLEELRADLIAEEARCEAARIEGRRAGTRAIALSRQIATLPCDIDRDRTELIIHLGFVHRVHVGGPKYSIERLRSIHDSVLKTEAAR